MDRVKHKYIDYLIGIAVGVIILAVLQKLHPPNMKNVQPCLDNGMYDYSVVLIDKVRNSVTYQCGSD